MSNRAISGSGGQLESSNPIEIDYFLARHENASWRDGLRPYFLYRDLGLSDASEGKLSGTHIRSRGTHAVSGWHYHDLRYQFFYVLQGEITLEFDQGVAETLGAGAVGWQPPLLRHNEQISEDYEALEITLPAEVKTVQEPNAPVPADAPKAGMYVRDTPAAHVADGRLRSFFTYRDLVPGSLTDGEMLIQEMHVIEEVEGGTGWHYHSMSQLFYVLAGWVYIAVEGKGAHTLTRGDAMCIGAGTAHNVSAFSEDYGLIEVCVPAVYSTTAVEAPQE